MPSKVAEGAQRGWIIPIGDAEEKENSPQILRRFVDLCGASGDPDIVVIPTASQLADTGARYENIFAELGVARVTAMDFDTRRDCEESSRLARLESATGVFFILAARGLPVPHQELVRSADRAVSAARHLGYPS